MHGLEPGANLGLAAGGGTDFNLDGIPDLFATDIENPSGPTPSRRVRIWSGANYLPLLTILEKPGDSGFGGAIDGGSDINGDGVPELLINIGGTTRFPGLNRAAVWVSGANGAELFPIGNPVALGFLSSVIEDINGDGIRDVLFGGDNLVSAHSGASGTLLYSLDQVRRNEGFGFSRAQLGDVNRDGVPDLALGTLGGSRNSPGHVYVYDGAVGQLLYELEGIHLGSEFGFSVAGVGDVEGDGIPDILVVAPSEDASLLRDPGAARLFSGANGRLIHIFRGDPILTEDVGQSVLGLGDVNGDGLDDVLIGSARSTIGFQGNGVWRTYGMRSYLNVFPQELSASAGGTLTFDITFPVSEANRDYRILASSDAPGRTHFFSVNLPLARTPVMERMVHDPPSSFLGARGTLDANGHATATWTIPPGAASFWVDRTLRFSAVTLAGPNDAGNYSAGMRVRLTN